MLDSVDFWRHVLSSSTRRLEHICRILVISCSAGKSEICDPHIEFCIDEDVVWLQISMNYALFVEMIHASHDLLKIVSRDSIGNRQARHEVLDQI